MIAHAKAFGVGCAKSGTLSIASMFEDSLRAAHEPSADTLLELILGFRTGKIPLEPYQAGVTQFYRGLDLDLNVSHMNGTIIRLLVQLHPHARYILTARDCRSWLRSCVNFHFVKQQLNNVSATWLAFRDITFQPLRFPHCAEDAPLREAGLYSLDSYLSYWVDHTALVIATVPAEQLLIVPTDRIGAESGRMTAFLEAAPGSANLAKTHMHAYPQVRTPLADLDPEYLAGRLAFYERKLLEAARQHLPHDVAEQAIGRGATERI